MRKFYIRDIRTHFDFYQCKREEGSPSNDEFNSKLLAYARATFGDSDVKASSSMLQCIIDNKEKYSDISDEFEDFKTEFGSLMLSFNRERMMRLLTKPVFANLLLHYLHQPHIVQQIVKSRGDSKTTRAYTKQVRSLIKLCLDISS